MVEKTACPSAEVLEDLIDGKLIDPQLHDLAEHLEDCATCQERAKTLAPHDTLVDALRGESPMTDAIAAEIPRPLVERIKQFPAQQADATLDTIVHPPASPPATGTAAVDFLRAAQ